MGKHCESLFARLFLIFASSTLGIFLVIGMTMDRVVEDHPRNQVSHRLLAYAVGEAGSPPKPEALRRLAEGLGWGLVAAGPGFQWSSSPDAPPLAILDSLAPDEPFGFFWHSDERWVAHRDGDWRAYATGFKVPLSAGAQSVIALGAIGLALVVFATYRSVLWLFSPIRDLRAGADRIAAGALGHRILSGRDDELGQLTKSVNSMADRLQETLEAKRQLLLAVGHELRTPLTRAKLLLEMQPENPGRDKLGRNLDEMSDLVTSLLDAEALSDPHVALNREPTHMEDLLRQCVDPTDSQFRIDVEPGLPMLVADPLRLRLTISNLVSNAVRHGGGAVLLTARQREGGIVVEVADHGPGIAPEHLFRLGEPFYRPDTARSRRTGGHGLGLYLSRRIVESHGGRLDIDSRLGQGTTVSVILPLEHSDK